MQLLKLKESKIVNIKAFNTKYTSENKSRKFQVGEFNSDEFNSGKYTNLEMQFVQYKSEHTEWEIPIGKYESENANCEVQIENQIQ